MHDINRVCQVILDAASINQTYLGFDCEWIPSSRISLIQICHKKSIYLFRVHSFNVTTFPEKLADAIGSEEIVKVGKNIAGDFTRLNGHFSIKVPEVTGKLDIGTICYQKGIIIRSGLRLDQICGLVLSRYLPKIPIIRCGNWGAPVLTNEQIKYAAIDAWISLEILNAVVSLPTVNQAVINGKVNTGTFVAVFSKSTSSRQMPSAYGYIEDFSKSPDVDSDQAIKAKKSVVKFIDVRIPGMLMDCYTTIDETKTLESFGEVPFVALINNKCLKTASESFYVRDKEEACAREAEAIQHINENNEVANRTNVPSRILKDAFHVMQMIKISLKHGMAKDFMRRFRDALFVVDPDEKKKVEEYLVSTGIDWN